MKIKLGLRGNSDAVNHIIIKMDDLTLVTGDNIFLIGEENRNKMGENIIKLLDALSVDNEIEIGDNVDFSTAILLLSNYYDLNHTLKSPQ